MNRRQALIAGAAATGWLVLSGHTPYRQWKLYRQSHLLLFVDREDAAAEQLAQALAMRLLEVLPESRARVARAPHAQRIASLLATDQADLALLDRAAALGMYAGRAPFDETGAIALRRLGEIETYQLVCREAMLPRHAYLLVQALSPADASPRLSLPVSAAGAGAEIPPHPGAEIFRRGEPIEP